MHSSTNQNCKCEQKATNDCQNKKCDCGCQAELLKEIYRTARMGVDSIEAVKKICEDGDFKELLNRERAGYVGISDQAEKIADDKHINVTATPVMEKAMLWGGVMMNSLGNKSTSKLAEMMIQGTNMGIIALKKAKNAYADDENAPLANELLHMFNDNLQELQERL